MKNLTFLLLFAGLLFWGAEANAQIIAQQDFNSLPSSGTITFDQLPSGVQLTNSGSRNIGGPGLDFASTWYDTRGVVSGPVTPSGDASDFIGVNSFAGSNAPGTAADGTPVASGTEHNFEFNDTDGAVVLNFEAVDVSGFTNRQLRLNYWINDTGFEADDALTISLSNGGLGIVLLGYGEAQLESFSDGTWKSLTVDVDAVLASSGLDPTTLILSIAVDVNASDENVFVDDIVFESVPTVPCNMTSLTAHFLPCWDRGTAAGDDDTFIADFTIKFTSPPTTGNIELLVGGQTYSTSVVGLGTQFQFLSIPLPANGQPIEATARFTAEPSCTITENFGTAPEPCSIIDPCTELLISEYVEGSGFNKCIEIYNPTDVDVDLASYGLFLSFNGGSFENTVPLTGTIASGDVYVICHSSATAEFLALADQTSGDLNFNGNDAVLLRNPDGTIDAIGQRGNAATFGANVTLRRKYEVQAGDNNPYDAFTTAEWDAYPSNTSWGLGYHATDCQPALPQGWSPVVIGCQDGSVAYDSPADEWTLTSACFNPVGSQDDLTFAFMPMCGNVEIVAEVKSVDFPGRAGVMIRETLAPNSKMAWLFQRSSFFGSFEYRTMTNGPLTMRQFPNLNRRFLKLTREGSIFRAYTSFNGITWQQVSQTFFTMSDCVYVGLALHSNVDGNPVSAVFSNVEVSPLGGFFSVEAGEDDLSLRENGLDLKVNESLSTEIWLQPNPAGSFLDVVSERWVEEPTVISIFDAAGQRVYTDRFDRFGAGLRLDLDVMNLAPGVYLLNMTYGNEVVTKRFVKQ